MRRMRNDQTETAGLDALSGGAAPAGRGLAAAEAAARPGYHPWRAVPFLCLGVGCGLFGGGTGELLAVQAMKKHPELQKQNEIAERDERNVAIGNAAKAKGYDVMTFAFGAMLLFSVLMEADLALTLVMVAVYLFIQFYSLWWRFKLEKEM